MNVCLFLLVIRGYFSFSLQLTRFRGYRLPDYQQNALEVKTPSRELSYQLLVCMCEPMSMCLYGGLMQRSEVIFRCYFLGNINFFSFSLFFFLKTKTLTALGLAD